MAAKPDWKSLLASTKKPDGTSLLPKAKPRPLEQGALYTVQERLDTFEQCNWPFDSGPCTPLRMAEAGFYFCGTDQAPDWVRCVVCHHDMEGWEETDDPLAEHKKHCPKCAFLKIKDPHCVTVGDVLDLERKALENFIKMQKKELEKDIDAVIAGMREELVKAATAEGYTHVHPSSSHIV